MIRNLCQRFSSSDRCFAFPRVKARAGNQIHPCREDSSFPRFERRNYRVLVTGAAGQIGYSILPRLISGEAFGRYNGVSLVLNDLPTLENVLQGIKMELEDCAFPEYMGCEIISDPELAYKDVDYVIMLANMMQLTPETTRFQLLKENKRVYSELAQTIKNTAKPTTRFLMVANPANTNCLLLMKSIDTIPSENFTCLTYLDYNRTVAAVARYIGVPNYRLRKVIVWGNHSSTMFPDLTHAEVYNPRSKTFEKVTDIIKDKSWIYEQLPQFVQTRFTSIIETRGKSSALSAANAAVCHLRDWSSQRPTDPNRWSCFGVRSIKQYGLPENIVFGTPCYFGNREYTVVENLTIDPLIREKMEISANELLSERDSIL